MYFLFVLHNISICLEIPGNSVCTSDFNLFRLCCDRFQKIVGAYLEQTEYNEGQDIPQ